MNLWLIFLTGLTTGGVSCLAVQGGLLASVIANQKEEELDTDQKQNKLASSFDQLDWLPVTMFLGAKLFSHVLLGLFLGWLGSKLELSITMKLIFQTIAALFMIGTALNLLEVHPIFRYLVIQPPKFFQRLVRGTSKGKALFTPAVLGFLTIFVPCGVTQSMEVAAISLGNPLQGALIMGAFVLGTSPLFALVGVATAKLSEAFQEKFTLQTITRPITYFFSDERFDYSSSGGSAMNVQNGVQLVQITVNNNGYSPRKIRVKAGVPVQLTVSTKDVYSCASSFMMKSFNVSIQLAPTDSKTVTFTPLQKGQYQFNCSMGMYKGIMEAI
jgi:sulfite exporter TauE/SafE